MATNSDIFGKIKEYLTESYVHSGTSVIPQKGDLTFGNTVKTIEHTKVLYIDMRKSREILTDANDFWSIKIHKAFLNAVIYCIERREGHIDYISSLSAITGIYPSSKVEFVLAGLSRRTDKRTW